MKKTVMVVATLVATVSMSAFADKATVDALVAAKVPLTDAQKAELTAQGCTDAASCNALTEAVAKVAAGLQGNDAAVTAVHTAFAKVHPAQAAAAIERTIALAPATAVTLAALQLDATPTAAGPLGVAQAAITAPASVFTALNNAAGSFTGFSGGGSPVSSSPSR